MKIAKSKTMLFALALTVFGAAQANLPGLQDVISPAVYGYLNMVFGVVVATLRFVTTKPLSDK